MQNLIDSVLQSQNKTSAQPFSVYAACREQSLLNVPVPKPMLVCVLKGNKELGSEPAFNVAAGHFAWLPGSAFVDMRNIPCQSNYLALLLEFEPQEFDALPLEEHSDSAYISGLLNEELTLALTQFIEWSASVPQALWSSRRKEILQLLHYQGCQGLASLVQHESLANQIHRMIVNNPMAELTATSISSQLAMSEATLHRKLRSQGASLQGIKDQARLGLGLHLIQTTTQPIGQIAEHCGYISPSRFTDKFKQQFGTTPRELRRTQLNDTNVSVESIGR